MACFSNSKYHLLYSTTIRKINSLSQLILYFPFKFIPRSIFSSSNYSIMNNTAEESYSGCTIYPPVYSMRFNCLRTVSFTCSRCANVSLWSSILCYYGYISDGNTNIVQWSSEAVIQRAWRINETLDKRTRETTLHSNSK